MKKRIFVASILGALLLTFGMAGSASAAGASAEECILTEWLEEKGYLKARYDGATPERGGRRKRLFTLTASGQNAIAKMREMREDMWRAIPKVALSNG